MSLVTTYCIVINGILLSVGTVTSERETTTDGILRKFDWPRPWVFLQPSFVIPSVDDFANLFLVRLEQLAELTESSKSYIWELENKDDPKPSAEKISRIAAALKVTTDFLITKSMATPDEAVLDEALFRKFSQLFETEIVLLAQYANLFT
jgi:transcriptional regulator with XRE-family HTH domain